MKKYLLILSGWAVDKFVWKAISNSLAKDFQIFIIDWDDVASLDGFKGKVINLLNEKGIDRFSMIGWSLGSIVALDIATSYCLRIDNMILFSPTSKFVQDEISNKQIGWNRRIVNRMISMLKKYPEKTLYSFYENLFTDTEVNNGYLKSFLDETNFDNKGRSIESLVLGLEYLIHKDVSGDLKNIDIPALLIHGSEDMICPIESGKNVDDNLKSSDLSILYGTGHMPFYTNFDRCNDLIINYISNKEGR